MINFLAEVSLRYKTILYPSPSPDDSRTIPDAQGEPTGIYYLNISPKPLSTYWTEWGGYYDEYVGTQIELYYNEHFLLQVNSKNELKQTKYSMYIDTSTYKVYFNIPTHPWLYPSYSAEGEEVYPFLSSALDPNNPTNNNIRGVAAQTRLEIPNFTVKLSDSISGITLNQDFDITLHNDDGYFDNDNEWDLFNTPVHLKKAVKENPQYDDFKEIRGGFAESTSTTFDEFRISVSDKLRNMEESVCKIIKQENFKDFSLITDVEGKYIPLVYGTKRLKPIKIWQQVDGNNKVIAARYLLAEYASGFTAYDKDGNQINSGLSLVNDMILYDTKLDADGKLVEVDTVTIQGYSTNKIGEIVKDIITLRTNIVYNNSNWNNYETQGYMYISPRINIAFTSGSIKNAIAAALKSDMAYFLQQMDGRFTMRKYGRTYGIHTIPAWALTQKPEKNYDIAQDNYFSSCSITYGFTGVDKNTFSLYFFDELENDAEDRYRKKYLSEYETDLIDKNDVIALARLLGKRYTTMRQRIKVSLGIDTYGMELLDIVNMDIMVNGREFSAAKKFIITEINPAQDILTLEEIE